MDRESKKHLKNRRCVHLAGQLATQRTREKADVIIECHGRDFYAHKIILENSAAYFVTLLQTKQDKYIIDELQPEVDELQPEVLGAILDYIYMGEVENVTSVEQFEKVAIAAHMLDLVDLKQYCCDSLGKTLSVSNFFERVEFNQRYSGQGSNLELSLLRFWEMNAKKLVVTNYFLSLPLTIIKGYILLLKKKRFSLDLMLRGVVQWLRHDWRARQTYLDELFETVDADFLTKPAVGELLRKYRTTHPSQDRPIVEWLKSLDAAIHTPNASRFKAAKPVSTAGNNKLSFYSNYRNIEVYDPATERNVVTRFKPCRCVQQFDLAGVSWLPLEIPYIEKGGKSWTGPLCQYGPHVYTIGEKKSWDTKDILEAQKNPRLPIPCPKLAGLQPDTKLCYFKDCLFTIGGSKNGRQTVFVHYIKLGQGEWREATTLSYVNNDMKILTSKSHMYVICTNPRVNDELIIQYITDPADEHNKQWEILRVLSTGLQPDQFFVLNNTLHAIYLDTENSKLLVFNTHLKQMKTKKSFAWPEGITESLVFSKFQNVEGSFVYFSKCTDYFSIPEYCWDPEKETWAKLDPTQGTCEIPNRKSVRMVYDVCTDPSDSDDM